MPYNLLSERGDKTMSEQVGAVSLGIKLDDSDLSSQIKKAGDSASKSSGGFLSNIFGASSSSAVTGAIGLVKTAAIGLTATLAGGGGLFALADSAVTAGNNVYELAQKMHLSSDEANTMNRMLSLSGTDSQSFISAMTKLDKATDSAGTKGNATTKAMQEFGVSITDSSGKLLPMNQQLAALAAGYKTAAANGNEEAYTSSILGTKGIALTGILADYNDVATEASQVKGIGIDPNQAHQAAMEMSELKMQVSVFGQVAGSAVMPIIQELMPELMSGLSGLADGIRKEEPEIQKVVSAFADLVKGVITTVVPAIEGIFGFIADHGELVKGVVIAIGVALLTWDVVSMITGIVEGIKAFQEANEGATIAQWAFDAAADANPIGILITVIAAVVGALIYFIATNKNVRDGFLSVWGDIVNFFKPAWDAIVTPIQAGLKVVEQYWNSIWPEVKETFTDVWDILKPIVETVISVWEGIFKVDLAILSSIWSIAWTSIKDALKTVWDLIAGVLKTAWDLISGAFKLALDVITGVFNVFKDIFTGNWSQLGKDLHTLVSNIWTDISSIFGNLFSDVKGIFTNLATDALQWGADLINGIIKGIKNSLGAVGDAAKGVASTIASFLHFSCPDTGPLADYETWMPDMMAGLAKGITANESKVTDAIAKVASSASKTVKASLSTLSQTATSDYDNLLSEISARNQKLQSDTQAVIDNYNQQVTSLTSSMMNTTSLFSDTSAPDASITAGSLTTDLQDQVTQLADYQSSMASLQSKGVSGGLLTELQSQGPAATQQLQALNSMTSEQLTQYVALWNQKTALATSTATSQLSDVKEQSEQQIQELNNQAAADLQGYVATWQSSTDGVESSLTTLAGKTSGIGKTMIDNLVSGIQSSTSSLSSTLDGIVSQVTSKLNSISVLQSAASIVSSVTSNAANAVASAIQTSGNLATAAKSSSTVVNANVTIDAKNVQDFNDVVSLVSNLNQTAKAGAA